MYSIFQQLAARISKFIHIRPHPTWLPSLCLKSSLIQLQNEGKARVHSHRQASRMRIIRVGSYNHQHDIVSFQLTIFIHRYSTRLSINPPEASGQASSEQAAAHAMAAARMAGIRKDMRSLRQRSDSGNFELDNIAAALRAVDEDLLRVRYDLASLQNRQARLLRRRTRIMSHSRKLHLRDRVGTVATTFVKTATENAVNRVVETAGAAGNRPLSAPAEQAQQKQQQSEVGGDSMSLFPPPRFRTPDSGDRSKRCDVALVSYPRSGSSLLRRMLERITGEVSGSDSRPDRALIQMLTEMGFQGEGVVDGNAVCVVKSHFPERLGWKPFTAHRVVLLVRNPLDAIDSYFNMILTQTHTKSIADEEYARLGHVWDEFVRGEIEVWKQFHAHWLAIGVPLLVVRFEDLMHDKFAQHAQQQLAPFGLGTGSTEAADIEKWASPSLAVNDNTKIWESRDHTLRRVVRFILGRDNLEDSIYNKRIRALTQNRNAHLAHMYKPRSWATAGTPSSPPKQSAVENKESSGNRNNNNNSSGDGNCGNGGNGEPKSGTVEQAQITKKKRGGLFKSLRHYTNEQVRYIIGTARKEMIDFGYGDWFYGDEPVYFCAICGSKDAARCSCNFGRTGAMHFVPPGVGTVIKLANEGDRKADEVAKAVKYIEELDADPRKFVPASEYPYKCELCANSWVSSIKEHQRHMARKHGLIPRHISLGAAIEEFAKVGVVEKAAARRLRATHGSAQTGGESGENHYGNSSNDSPGNKSSNVNATVCMMNTAWAIRARTKDDPYGRGFQRRWQGHIDALAPIHLLEKRNMA